MREGKIDFLVVATERIKFGEPFKNRKIVRGRGFLFLFLALLLINPKFSLAQYVENLDGWEEVRDKDGIRVFKKNIPGSPVVAFRGVAYVNAGIGKVIKVISDKSRSTEWVNRMEEAKTVRSISPFESVEYVQMRSPWPVSNRDFVFHSIVEIDQPNKKVTIKLHSVDDPLMPERRGIVRGELLTSQYTLTALGKNKTHVDMEIHGDPKGWIPKWVVNLIQRIWPIITIKGLREQVTKKDLGEDPSYQSFADYYLPVIRARKD